MQKSTRDALAGIVFTTIIVCDVVNALSIMTLFRYLLWSRAIPYALLLLGLLVFLWSVLCGSLALALERRGLQQLYLILLGALLVMQIVVTAVAFLEPQDESSERVTDWMNSAWDKAYRDRPEDLRRLEHEYQCCGFRNLTDRAIPKYPRDACHKTLGYDRPCLEVIWSSFRDGHMRLGWFALAATLTELFAFIYLCWYTTYTLTDEEREERVLAEHSRLLGHRQQISGRGRHGRYGGSSRRDIRREEEISILSGGTMEGSTSEERRVGGEHRAPQLPGARFPQSEARA